MKRVLQISNYLYPNIGGIEQTARDIANSISDIGEFEQKIICFNETASDGTVKCERKETVRNVVDGVEVIRCGCIAKINSQSISLTMGREMKRVMNSFKPDIVIFHYPNPFEAFFLLPHLKRNVRFILYWHLDIVKQKTLAKLFHWQTLRLLRRADTVVATSPLYIKGSPYLSRFSGKCKVIPSCINEERLRITDETQKYVLDIKKKNKGKIICFSVGRHIPYKGFKYLVEASKYLDDRFKIYIGGKGELTSELKALAKDDKKIVFLGRISNEELIAYYQAMDFFCFPSITKNEAFGLALAEAMYFGKPAITFHIPGSGVNYVNVKNVTGLEVENGNSREYAKAMKKLADDDNLRKQLGIAAQKRVEGLLLKKQFKNNIRKLLLDE